MGMFIRHLVKIPPMKFHENLSVGIALSREVRRTDGRTDGRKDFTRLIIVFVTAMPTPLKMNSLALCREVRQRVRNKKSEMGSDGSLQHRYYKTIRYSVHRTQISRRTLHTRVSPATDYEQSGRSRRQPC
jgi:hypothetical protein